MGRKVTVSLTVTYDFGNRKLREEFLDWVGDENDTRSMRRWFAIDRAFGHNNIETMLAENIFDPKVRVKVEEK